MQRTKGFPIYSFERICLGHNVFVNLCKNLSTFKKSRLIGLHSSWEAWGQSWLLLQTICVASDRQLYLLPAFACLILLLNYLLLSQAFKASLYNTRKTQLWAFCQTSSGGPCSRDLPCFLRAVTDRTFEKPLPCFSCCSPRTPHFTLPSLWCMHTEEYMSCGSQP